MKRPIYERTINALDIQWDNVNEMLDNTPKNEYLEQLLLMRELNTIKMCMLIVKDVFNKYDESEVK